MSQQELLKKVVGILEQIGIEYMLTGSVVSSLQGEPRSTHDIDMVIAIQSAQVHSLSEAFAQPDYYLDENSVLEAIKQSSMFNLLEINSGDKVDFWMLGEDKFDQLRFSRKYGEDFEGIKIKVSTPEDTILSKLRWAKLSEGSEKQFGDALRVYEVQYANLDKNYLEEWSKELGLEALWKRLKDEAEPL